MGSLIVQLFTDPFRFLFFMFWTSDFQTWILEALAVHKVTIMCQWNKLYISHARAHMHIHTRTSTPPPHTHKDKVIKRVHGKTRLIRLGTTIRDHWEKLETTFRLLKQIF